MKNDALGVPALMIKQDKEDPSRPFLRQSGTQTSFTFPSLVWHECIKILNHIFENYEPDFINEIA